MTGGSGFLGSHVIPLLVAQGYEVAALARSCTAAARVTNLGATPISGDLDKPDSVGNAFQVSDAQVLLNLAPLRVAPAPTIVAAAEDAQIGRGIFVSTTASLDSRGNVRSNVVHKTEKAIKGSKLQWTILRPTMIYGTADDRNMGRLLPLLRKLPVIPLPGGGQGLQQPVHVDDVAAAVVAALTAVASIRKCYNIAGPEPLTLRDILKQAATAVGCSPRLMPLPLAPTVIAVRLLERVVPGLPVTSEQIERLADDKAFDISAARRDLGFSPRPFAIGIYQQAQLQT